MVILGVLAATDSLAREAGPAGRDPKFFYIIPLTDMLIFATLIFFALRARSNPPAHKRLIFVATTALLIAAIARWPFGFVFRNAPVARSGDVRPVVHAQGASRDDLGSYVAHLRAADQIAYRQDRGVAHVCQLGPIRRALT
jgi:hypothetical protein